MAAVKSINTQRTMERNKWEIRDRRSLRVRSSVRGTSERPRLSVFRSHKHIYAQVIDDEKGVTLVSAATISDKSLKHGGTRAAAEAIGKKIAELAQKKGILKVCFDRSWYRFHGRVRALAEAARKAGLKF